MLLNKLLILTIDFDNSKYRILIQWLLKSLPKRQYE